MRPSGGRKEGLVQSKENKVKTCYYKENHTNLIETMRNLVNYLAKRPT